MTSCASFNQCVNPMFDEFSIQLRALLDQDLPGEEAHRIMMPDRRPYNPKPENKDSLRDAAVAILLYPENNSIRSVLIKRPTYEGAHSDQIAFPGGKKDTSDPNLIFTSRRECFEEVNLPMEEGLFVGSLTDIYVPVSGFIVRPNVFLLNERPALIPDMREVASIIHFDVKILTDVSTLQSKDMRIRKGMLMKNIPYFNINDHVVWGATAMMLAELRELIQKIKI